MPVLFLGSSVLVHGVDVCVGNPGSSGCGVKRSHPRLIGSRLGPMRRMISACCSIGLMYCARAFLL